METLLLAVFSGLCGILGIRVFIDLGRREAYENRYETQKSLGFRPEFKHFTEDDRNKWIDDQMRSGRKHRWLIWVFVALAWGQMIKAVAGL